MVLNRHRALLGPNHAGARAVVEVDVGDLNARGQGLGVHGEVVVLRRNLNRIVGAANGVVTAVVTEFELKRCLLYTSPSPRDATLSRMPSSA